ncbi:MAG: hypothetical protein C0483_13375 [Pirellula sp.]|nr:hypothetical protein [Pirellula sp.]
MKNERGRRRRKVVAPQELPHVLRSDGAHREPAAARGGAQGTDELRDSPATTLQLGDPAVMERLEELDDVVFEAIAGKNSAIEQLQQLWPKVIGRLSPSLAEESREAYCRHALQKWLDCTENGNSRNPKLAVSLMDVLAVLLAQRGR